ncbi:hypothetical protein T10_2020, partial [Trichinella papuae]
LFEGQAILIVENLFYCNAMFLLKLFKSTYQAAVQTCRMLLVSLPAVKRSTVR